MQRTLTILAAMLLCLGLAAAASAGNSRTNQAKPNINQWTGSYTTRVGGWYSGTDVVVVNAGGKLHLIVKVVGEDGKKYGFNVPNIDASTGYFEDVLGNINGAKVVISGGRFDAPAPGEPFAARFTCNYVDASGRAGRIVGIKTN